MLDVFLFHNLNRVTIWIWDKFVSEVLGSLSSWAPSSVIHFPFISIFITKFCLNHYFHQLFNFDHHPIIALLHPSTLLLTLPSITVSFILPLSKRPFPYSTLLRIVLPKIHLSFLSQGSIINGSIFLIHADTKYWDAPEEFRPERWLSEEGKFVTKKEGFMPFGSGTLSFWCRISLRKYW